MNNFPDFPDFSEVKGKKDLPKLQKIWHNFVIAEKEALNKMIDTVSFEEKLKIEKVMSLLDDTSNLIELISPESPKEFGQIIANNLFESASKLKEIRLSL
jgi:hypothetical protein